MILFDPLEKEQLQYKIRELEIAFNGLDPDLDYREYYMTMLQLSIHYRMLMDDFSNNADISNTRQSTMNSDNLIQFSYVRSKNIIKANS